MCKVGTEIRMKNKLGAKATLHTARLDIYEENIFILERSESENFHFGVGIKYGLLQNFYSKRFLK